MQRYVESLIHVIDMRPRKHRSRSHATGITQRTVTMHKEEYLIHQSALTVRSFLTLERDLGRSPTWEEFVAVGHTDNTQYTLQVRSILRGLWLSLLLPELSRITQCFSAEILTDALCSDIYLMGVDIACAIHKKGGTPTVEIVLLGTDDVVGLLDRSGPAYDALADSQKDRLSQDLAAFINDLSSHTRQSAIECSAGLEHMGDSTNEDIPF